MRMLEYQDVMAAVRRCGERGVVGDVVGTAPGSDDVGGELQGWCLR